MVYDRETGRHRYDPKDTMRINTKGLLRVQNDFPPKTHVTFEFLVENAIEKGNSDAKSIYYLDQADRVQVQIYFKRIIKATAILFFKPVRARGVFKKLWKVQVEIEASTISPKWKDILIKLAEHRKFLFAFNEMELVPKQFYWTPVRS